MSLTVELLPDTFSIFGFSSCISSINACVFNNMCLIIAEVFSSHPLYWKTSHREDDQGNEYIFVLWWRLELRHLLGVCVWYVCMHGMCAWGLFPITAWTCDPKQCPDRNAQAVQTLLPPTAPEGHCPAWRGKFESALLSATSFHVQELEEHSSASFLFFSRLATCAEPLVSSCRVTYFCTICSVCFSHGRQLHLWNELVPFVLPSASSRQQTLRVSCLLFPWWVKVFQHSLCKQTCSGSAEHQCGRRRVSCCPKPVLFLSVALCCQQDFGLV